ncbi:tetratricopeptide repeat protein [Nodosilinea sp. FACHB-141]|nr:tetratricopeptide repeat protein [Nodosilinea sp. FACHB-141]
MTAANIEDGAKIKITLINKWGVLIRSVRLSDIRLHKSVNEFASIPFSIDYEISTPRLEVLPTETDVSVPHNLPRSGVSVFIGREAELAILNKKLQQDNQVAIVGIEGMGGIGKTELALQYASSHCQIATYSGGICWIKAREDIGIQIVSFAKTRLNLNPPDDLNLNETVAFCWQNWDAGNVLIILDDVQDYKSIQLYLPPAEPRFKVLLTTRLRLSPPVETLSLEVLTQAETLELLRSFLGSERTEQQFSDAIALSQWLGNLPLALELVGSYLTRKPDLSLAVMLQRLENKRLDALAVSQSEIDMTASLGIKAAFELSWEELETSAQNLARLLGLFALAPIPWKLVELCLPEWDEEELEDLRDKQLLNLHLLQRVESDIYQLHPLTREFFNTRLSQAPEAEVEQYKRQFCQVMAEQVRQISQVLTRAEIESLTVIVPHLQVVTTQLAPTLSDEDLIWAFLGIARFYEEQGLFAEAEPWLQECLNATRTRLGEKHPTVAASLNNLAALYQSQGRYAEAETYYLQSLNLMQSLWGRQHRDVATSLSNLAEVYRAQGRYAEAEPLYLQALELRRLLLDGQHPDIAASINNLAALYEAQGRYAEAEPLYVQALQLRRALLGEQHPSIATSFNNLAGLYVSQGRYAEAEPLYLQALQLRRVLLGEQHPSIATSLNNLAYLYVSQGRYAEAEPLYVQALQLRRVLLGEQHLDFAASLNNLAELYCAQGRYAEAEPLYLQALDLVRSYLGEGHPSNAAGLNNLAELYRAQRRYADAEPLYLQALQLRKSLLGELHPDVAASLNNLANLYYSLERYSDAEALYREALRIWQGMLGENHPAVATSLNNLAGLYSVQNRYEDAEELYRKALVIRQAALGENHPEVLATLNNLTKLYQVQGRYSDTEEVKAAKISDSSLSSQIATTPTISTLTANTILTVALARFSDSNSHNLQEKFTKAGLLKIDELYRSIREKIQGNQKQESALISAEQGSKTELDNLATYLETMMNDDTEFAAEIQHISQEIYAEKLKDNTMMVQNNYDNAKGWQTKIEGGTAYIGEIHNQ